MRWSTRTSVFNKTIAKLIQDGNHLHARLVYNDMLVDSIIPTLRTFDLLLANERKAPRPDLPNLKYLLREMQKHGFRLEVGHYNEHMMLLRRIGEFQDIIRVFESMERNKVEPNASSFALAVTAYCRHGMRTEGLQMLRRMQLRGFAPDELVYTSLVMSAIDEGNTKLALKYFSDMKVAGVVPAARSYRLMLRAAVGDPATVIDLLTTMDEKKMLASPGVFVLALNACLAPSRFDLAARVVELVIKNDVPARHLLKLCLAANNNDFSLKAVRSFVDASKERKVNMSNKHNLKPSLGFFCDSFEAATKLPSLELADALLDLFLLHTDCFALKKRVLKDYVARVELGGGDVTSSRFIAAQARLNTVVEDEVEVEPEPELEEQDDDLDVSKDVE